MTGRWLQGSHAAVLVHAADPADDHEHPASPVHAVTADGRQACSGETAAEVFPDLKWPPSPKVACPECQIATEAVIG